MNGPAREDIYISMLTAFTEHPEISGEYVMTQTAPVETVDKDRWFTWQLESIRPEQTAAGTFFGRGVVRVQSVTRPGVTGVSTQYSDPWKHSDRAVRALDFQDVVVRDWSDTVTPGDQITGQVSYDRVQQDDPGEAINGARVIINTVEFQVSYTA